MRKFDNANEAIRALVKEGVKHEIVKVGDCEFVFDENHEDSRSVRKAVQKQ